MSVRKKAKFSPSPTVSSSPVAGRKFMKTKTRSPVVASFKKKLFTELLSDEVLHDEEVSKNWKSFYTSCFYSLNRLGRLFPDIMTQPAFRDNFRESFHAKKDARLLVDHLAFFVAVQNIREFPSESQSELVQRVRDVYSEFLEGSVSIGRSELVKEISDILAAFPAQKLSSIPSVSSTEYIPLLDPPSNSMTITTQPMTAAPTTATKSPITSTPSTTITTTVTTTTTNSLSTTILSSDIFNKLIDETITTLYPAFIDLIKKLRSPSKKFFEEWNEKIFYLTKVNTRFNELLYFDDFLHKKFHEYLSKEDNLLEEIFNLYEKVYYYHWDDSPNHSDIHDLVSKILSTKKITGIPSEIVDFLKNFKKGKINCKYEEFIQILEVFLKKKFEEFSEASMSDPLRSEYFTKEMKKFQKDGKPDFPELPFNPLVMDMFQKWAENNFTESDHVMFFRDLYRLNFRRFISEKHMSNIISSLILKYSTKHIEGVNLPWHSQTDSELNQDTLEVLYKEIFPIVGMYYKQFTTPDDTSNVLATPPKDMKKRRSKSTSKISLIFSDQSPEESKSEKNDAPTRDFRRAFSFKSIKMKLESSSGSSSNNNNNTNNNNINKDVISPSNTTRASGNNTNRTSTASLNSSGNNGTVVIDAENVEEISSDEYFSHWRNLFPHGVYSLDYLQKNFPQNILSESHIRDFFRSDLRSKNAHNYLDFFIEINDFKTKFQSNSEEISADLINTAKSIAAKYFGVTSTGTSTTVPPTIINISKASRDLFLSFFSSIETTSPSSPQSPSCVQLSPFQSDPSHLGGVFDTLTKEILDILRANFSDMCTRVGTQINDALSNWRTLEIYLTNVTVRFGDLIFDEYLRKKFIDFLSANFPSDVDLYFFSESIWRIYWKNEPTFDEGEKLLRSFTEKHVYSTVDISGHSKHKLPIELAQAIESYFQMRNFRDQAGISDSQNVYEELMRVTTSLMKTKFEAFSTKVMSDKTRTEIYAREIKTFKKNSLGNFRNFWHMFYHPIIFAVFCKHITQNAAQLELLTFCKTVWDFHNRKHVSTRHMMENVMEIRNMLTSRKYPEFWPQNINIDAIIAESGKPTCPKSVFDELWIASGEIMSLVYRDFVSKSVTLPLSLNDLLSTSSTKRRSLSRALSTNSKISLTAGKSTVSPNEKSVDKSPDKRASEGPDNDRGKLVGNGADTERIRNENGSVETGTMRKKQDRIPIGRSYSLGSSSDINHRKKNSPELGGSSPIPTPTKIFSETFSRIFNEEFTTLSLEAFNTLSFITIDNEILLGKFEEILSQSTKLEEEVVWLRNSLSSLSNGNSIEEVTQSS